MKPEAFIFAAVYGIPNTLEFNSDFYLLLYLNKLPKCQIGLYTGSNKCFAGY